MSAPLTYLQRGCTISSTICIARDRPVAWNPIVLYDLRSSSSVIGFERSGPLIWTASSGKSSEGMSTLACALEVEDDASADILYGGIGMSSQRDSSDRSDSNFLYKLPNIVNLDGRA
jgi:hypothetical protein